MKSIIALLLLGTAASAWAEASPNEGDKYVFVRDGRRDPFTFSLPPKLEADPKPRESEDIELKEQNAHNLVVRAEDAAMNRRAADCIDACDRALRQLRDVSDERPGIAQLRQNLQALRKVGDAMQQRAEAATAFQRLNVSVSGVVARPRKAQAIVNGVVVREGQTLHASGNELLVVEKISADQVVLNFRGYRMATTLASAE